MILNLNPDRMGTAAALLALIGIGTALFVLDIATPLGVADGGGYAALMIGSLWLPGRRSTVIAAIIYSVLIAAGYAIAPDEGVGTAALINRVLALLALWVATVILIERKHAQSELVKKSAEAKASSRAKSVFLATMTHEFRTPLTAIIGFSDVLKDRLTDLNDDRHAGYAKDIGKAGDHLLAMLNEVLEFADIDAGRVELREEAVNLPELVASCCALAAARAREAGVSVERSAPEGLPLVGIGRLRMKQALLSILSNAIKFTRPGGRASITAMRMPGDGVTIAVVDTGIGMSAADMPLALIPFQQVDSKLDRQFGGVGLGLSFAKMLVELHGGSLNVDSQVGQGTTVTIGLPETRIIAGTEIAAARGGARPYA